MDLKKAEELLRFMREHGLVHASVDGVELRLADGVSAPVQEFVEEDSVPHPVPDRDDWLPYFKTPKATEV